MSDLPSKAKPTASRFAVAANVKHLMENYQEGFQRGLTTRRLEKKCGVSYKTLDRLLDPYADTGPSLDTLDAIARFFGLETYELLKPHPLAAAHKTPDGKPSPASRKARLA